MLAFFFLLPISGRVLFLLSFMAASIIYQLLSWVCRSVRTRLSPPLKQRSRRVAEDAMAGDGARSSDALYFAGGTAACVAERMCPLSPAARMGESVHFFLFSVSTSCFEGTVELFAGSHRGSLSGYNHHWQPGLCLRWWQQRGEWDGPAKTNG